MQRYASSRFRGASALSRMAGGTRNRFLTCAIPSSNGEKDWMVTDTGPVEVHHVTIEDREVAVSQLMLMVIELSDAMAEATGVDLVSAAAAGIDADGARRIVGELGLTGRAYVKTVEGRSYLILRGRPGLRPTLTGTRYLTTNPKVVNMVVTPANVAATAARATGIAVIAYAGLRIVEFILHDEDGRLARLLGTLATDIVRFAIAAGAGFLTAVVVGTFTTVVAAPLVAAIAVSLLASMALDRLDRRLGITETLVGAIQARFDHAGSLIQGMERRLIDYAICRQMRLWGC